MSEQPTALVTAAEISRLAGVTRATVSNWRRRHADFPTPVGGTDTSPAYDLTAVRAWLAARDQLPEASPADELRVILRSRADAAPVIARLFPVVLAAATLGRNELMALAELPDDNLASWSRSATDALARDIPGIAAVTSDGADAAPLRALLRQVIAEDAEAAAGILFERLLEDSSVVGTYITPAPLAELMTGLLADESGTFPKCVLDPACGSGSLLAAAARRGATELHGQDAVTGQAAQAAVRVRLAAPDADVTVRAGDSLRSDALSDVTADAVLCNPPYGDRDWGHEELAYDQRWAYGVPPKGEPELAWVQHCVSHLEPGARAVLLMPPAVAERPSGRRIRAQLVRDGALCAVIALPQGSAAPLHVGLNLWILQRPGPMTGTPDTVLFVDASTTEQGVNWPTLEATVTKAWRAYRAGEDLTDAPAARAVPLIDLLDESVDLTPVRHVRTAHATASPKELARQAAELHDRLYRAATEVGDLSERGDWRAIGDQPRSWRTATVADLLRGGAVKLMHAAPRRTRRGETPSAAEPQDGAHPVLTARDVVEGRTASGTAADLMKDKATYQVKPGDVLLPELFSSERSTATRVAEAGDDGCVLGPNVWLFRPDPQRLDAWFLAGFLSAEENVSAATTGTSIVRVDPRRLRVPLLPLAEQRRYGDAFRHLHTLRTTARRTARHAEETARLLNAGLTGGALSPPGHESA